MDICGKYINPHFFTDIYMTYKKSKDYFTMNLDIERWMLFLDVWKILFSKDFVLRQKFPYQKKKEKEIVYFAFDRQLLSCIVFHEYFVEHYWLDRKRFSSEYYFIYPHLNQSLRWKNNYIFSVKKEASKR